MSLEANKQYVPKLDSEFKISSNDVQVSRENDLLNEEFIDAAVKKEFIRQLRIHGYEHTEAKENNREKIWRDGQEIACYDVENDMLFKLDKQDEMRLIFKIKNEVSEYVPAYLRAKENGAEKNQGYYILLDWNRYVLGACQLQDGFFKFVTWMKAFSGNGYEIGHYYTDFTSAKKDFAMRSEMINKNMLFDEPQLIVIRSSLLDFLNLDDGSYLNKNKEDLIKSIISKIDDFIEQ